MGAAHPLPVLESVTAAASGLSQWLCALSLPGGGIRQANFAIGVVLRLVAAAPRSDTPLWRNVDMVSAVSGGILEFFCYFK